MKSGNEMRASPAMMRPRDQKEPPAAAAIYCEARWRHRAKRSLPLRQQIATCRPLPPRVGQFGGKLLRTEKAAATVDAKHSKFALSLIDGGGAWRVS